MSWHNCIVVGKTSANDKLSGHMILPYVIPWPFRFSYRSNPSCFTDIVTLQHGHSQISTPTQQMLPHAENVSGVQPANMMPQALAMLFFWRLLNLIASPMRPNRIGIMMKRHSQRTCFSICIQHSAPCLNSSAVYWAIHACPENQCLPHCPGECLI